MRKISVKIILPKTASTSIEMDLVKLTEFLSKKFNLYGGSGLGGDNGYGVDFENDVFMMKPFCWCDREDCDWCAVNTKKLQRRLLKKFKNKDWAEKGIAPNFWHKPSGFMIRWYKFIGRDMEFSKEIKPREWKKIYSEVIKSLK
jgi:hypothetical protein